MTCYSVLIHAHTPYSLESRNHYMVCKFFFNTSRNKSKLWYSFGMFSFLWVNEGVTSPGRHLQTPRAGAILTLSAISNKELTLLLNLALRTWSAAGVELMSVAQAKSWYSQVLFCHWFFFSRITPGIAYHCWALSSRWLICTKRAESTIRYCNQYRREKVSI